eukprot:1147463-Pelagomonas_calceolata.AAC.2
MAPTGLDESEILLLRCRPSYWCSAKKPTYSAAPSDPCAYTTSIPMKAHLWYMTPTVPLCLLRHPTQNQPQRPFGGPRFCHPYYETFISTPVPSSYRPFTEYQSFHHPAIARGGLTAAELFCTSHVIPAQK